MRTIREDDEVVEFFEKMAGRYPRLVDAWERGWQWRLSRDPFEDAHAVNIPGIAETYFLLKTRPEFGQYGVPSITLLFTVTETMVCVVGVQLTNLG